VRSRRFLLLLLLVVSLDFALPYPPTARGWGEFEDEETSIHPDGHRLERPGATDSAPAQSQSVAAARGRPAAVRVLTPSPMLLTRLARADTSSAPASPDAH
jgi:hypothetical protein